MEAASSIGRGGGRPRSIVLELSRIDVPEDPHAFRFVPQDYTLRTSGGGRARLSIDWSEALLADLRALARPDRGPELAQRIGDRLRSALESAGWRALGEEIAAAADAGQRVIVTLRANAAELYALPWELLTVDASGRHLGELREVVLRYEWPETRTRPAEPTPRPEGGRVLVAWSAAGGPVPIGEHLRVIKRAYADGHLGFDDERDQLGHASVDAIVRKLARASEDGEPYAILHLLCHGGRAGSSYGLVLQDPEGGLAVSDAAALRAALEPHARTLRLVVLAACESGDVGAPGNHLGSVAQALHRVGIEAVVASRYPLSVKGSITLSEAFYRALAVDLASLEEAFAAARAALVVHERFDWASVQLYARAADGDDTRPIVLRPYRGLLAFTSAHRRFFFGRDREIAALVARVEAARSGERPGLQLVVGPSGVGKSSLVLGGLIPALSRPARGEGGPWTCVVVRPEGGLKALWSALHDLRRAQGRLRGLVDAPPAVYSPAEVMEEAHALRAGDPGGSLLLAVDPFEELFTAITAASEREALARALWRLAGRRELGVIVVATLRADYVGHCRGVVLDEEGADLAAVAADERHASMIAPIDGERLAQLVERPAARVGLEFQEGLVARILGDLAGSVEALPLLAVTLDELWLRRSGRTLTLGAYEALDGLRGSITRAAERAIEAMTPAERAQARRVLVRAMKPGLRDGDATRDHVDTDLLRPRRQAEAEHFDRAVAALVRARLLVAGDDELADLERGAWVEVAHEALIRHWPRLLEWEREDRPTLTRLRAWRGRCDAWIAGGRGPGELLGGEELARALAELGEVRRLGEVGVDLEAFLGRSEEAEARRQEDEARRLDRQRRAALIASVALALIAALLVALSVVAVEARREARASEGRARRSAWLAAASRWRAEIEAQRARDAIRMRLARGLDRDPTARLALLREIECPERTPGYRSAAAAATRAPVSVAVLDAGAAITAAAQSPDGTLIATASIDGVARLWSADGAPVRELRGHQDALTSVAFSPTGAHLVTGSRDQCAQVWKLRGDEAPRPLCGHLGAVTQVVVSPDGDRLITVSEGERKARIWRIQRSGLVRELDGHPRNVRAAAFAPRGDLALTVAGKEAWVWSGGEGEGRPVAVHERMIQAAAFSPDAAQVATVDVEGRVRLWSTGLPGEAGEADGEVDGEPEPPAPARAWSTDREALSIAWSPDGRRVAVATAAAAHVLTPASGAVERLAHAGADPIHYRVLGAAWAADGRRLLTADTEGIARLFDLERGGAPRALLGHTQRISSALFVAGDRVATASEDGTLRLWSTDVDAGLALVGHDDAITDAAWIADDAILSGSRDQTARIWALGGDEPRRLAHDGVVTSVAVDVDGARLLTTSEDRRAYLWDRRGRPLPGSPLVHDHGVTRGLFVPGSADVITIAKDHRVRRWSLAGPIAAPQVLCAHDDVIYDAAVSPDGAWVATASADGTGRLCPVGDGGPARALDGHRREVLAVAWSPDGARLVTGSRDRSARIWGAAEEARVIPLLGHATEIRAAAFSPRGERLITGADDGSARVWGLGGALVRELRGPRAAPLRALAWGPDGATVVTGATDGSVRLWQVDGADEPVVLADEGEAITVVAYAPGGARVLSAGESGVIQVSTIASLERLRAGLAASPAACLAAGDRVALLGESAHDAAAAAAHCRGEGPAPRQDAPVRGFPPLCPALPPAAQSGAGGAEAPLTATGP